MKLYVLMATLIAGTSHSAPLASDALSTIPHQRDLKSVRKEIDTLKKDIAKKQAVQKEAQSAIKESEQAIHHTNQVLVRLEKKQSSSEQQLDALRAEINASQNSLTAVRQRVGMMLARQYKNGKHDAMRLMMNAHDPNQRARDLAYFQHIARAQQLLLAHLVTQQNELTTLSFELEQELARLNSLSHRKSREKESLQRDKASRQQELHQATGAIKSGQSKLSQLQENENRLTGLITEINKEIQRQRAETARRAAEERRARLATARETARKEIERRHKEIDIAKKQSKSVREEPKKTLELKEVPITEVADEGVSGRAFVSLLGRMKMPVAGELVGRFGKQRQQGVSWKGVFIQAANGSTVRSVADGTVVFADQLRGFGNAILINHGGNYMTVYTGLSVIGRSVGKSIKAGEIIGNTGTLDSGESGLYFEIRHMGRPLNPQTWAR